MQKLVLLVLANRHNSDTGRCDPSLARLAKDCGLGRTTTLRALDLLGVRGLVGRTRRKAEGVFASTAYTLQMGVVAETDNVVSQRDNPLVAETDNGSTAAGQGVVPQRDINQEVKPVREPKEETRAEKPSKLTVIRGYGKDKDTHSEIPSGMPSESWQNYVAMRKEIGKPVTPTAAKMLAHKIEKLKADGHSPTLLLDKATEHQWRSVYPGDDTKAPAPKREYVTLTAEEAAAQWERDFGRAAGV